MTDIEKLAHEIGDNFFHDNWMEVVGAMVIGDEIYIRGFDGGFPHAHATAKFDLKTHNFLKSWDCYDCPITVKDGVFV